MADIAETRRVKIPLWRTVGHSYVILAENLWGLLRYASHWFLLALIVSIAMDWIAWPATQRVLAEGDAGDPQVANFSLLDVGLHWIGLLDTLIPLLCVVPVFVAWHRMIVYNHSFADSLNRTTFEIGLTYAVAAGLLALPLFLGLVFLESFAGIGIQGAEWVGAVGFNVVVVIALFCVPRLAIRLVAIAIGRRNVSWPDVWRRSRGNTLRLMFGDLLVVLPLSVFVWWLVLIEDPISREWSALQTTIETAGVILTTLVEAGFFSLAYLHLFKKDDASEPEGS